MNEYDLDGGKSHSGNRVGVHPHAIKELLRLELTGDSAVSLDLLAIWISFVVFEVCAASLGGAQTVHQEGMCFVDSGLEVLTVGQKLREINGVLIQKHSCNSWGILVAISCLDDSVNVVTHEVVSLLTCLTCFQSSDVD